MSPGLSTPMTTLPSPLTSGSLSPEPPLLAVDDDPAAALDESPTVAALDVFGALAALLAQAASRNAAAHAMPIRARENWLILRSFPRVISRPARARWSVGARRNRCVAAGR